MNHDDLLKAAEPTSHGGTSAATLAEVPRQGCPDLLEAWIRRVNDRWLVRSGLNHHARAYMDRLVVADPRRLARSCEIVHRLMKLHDPESDPKPWFYGGLFSLATPEEESQYLDGHRFTRMLLPSTPEGRVRAEAEDLELAPEVLRRVQNIRSQIREQIYHTSRVDVELKAAC
ncbi:hypothetical protein [Verrucomicrobium sp. BvORR106]|uniref:hypothetical protein n=1 Tax=Verrucomicrobium sp. BvORR106 TaxID=1403819 RepID=UPI002240F62E|nr:hypothetical protein [Verrucomicrobium sp. BvORR106]